MRTLVAYLNETRVGVLSESDDLWRFEYDRNWVNASGSFDLSPALKRTQLLHQDGSSLRTLNPALKMRSDLKANLRRSDNCMTTIRPKVLTRPASSNPAEKPQ